MLIASSLLLQQQLQTSVSLIKNNIATMADDKAVEGATKAMAEVRLDENGEPLSKNALKKLLKKEAADKKKAEKAAARVRYDT